MIDTELFHSLVLAWTALGVAVFVLLRFIRAPYGRHARQGWGPTWPARRAWIVMESVSLFGFVALFVVGARFSQPICWLFLALWVGHYLHRAWIYPLRTRDRGTRMPVLVMLMAIVFNTMNASLNGGQLFVFGEPYSSAWLTDPRLLVGVGLFVTGFVVNLSADNTLLRLRQRTPGGYQIPRGGLYRWVSCPNYLGEILEWLGWALATWSLAGLSFALWTIANLLPRALAHHRWYRAGFADYPAERKAIVPFVL